MWIFISWVAHASFSRHHPRNLGAAVLAYDRLQNYIFAHQAYTYAYPHVKVNERQRQQQQLHHRRMKKTTTYYYHYFIFYNMYSVCSWCSCCITIEAVVVVVASRFVSFHFFPFAVCVCASHVLYRKPFGDDVAASPLSLMMIFSFSFSFFLSYYNIPYFSYHIILIFYLVFVREWANTIARCANTRTRRSVNYSTHKCEK